MIHPSRFSARPQCGLGTGLARGMVLVELAFVLPINLLLVLATIDMGRLFYTQVTLQHAMREGGRFGVTGNTLANPGNPGVQQSRIESIKRKVREAAVGVDVEPQDIRVSSVYGGADSAGGAGDTFTLSMTYEFLFVTPIVGDFFGEDGSYNFTVSTTFRNEPFQAGAG